MAAGGLIPMVMTYTKTTTETFGPLMKTLTKKKSGMLIMKFTTTTVGMMMATITKSISPWTKTTNGGLKKYTHGTGSTNRLTRTAANTTMETEKAIAIVTANTQNGAGTRMATPGAETGTTMTATLTTGIGTPTTPTA